MRRKDQKFLDWVSRQPSCLNGEFSEWHDGVGRSIACHVRRAANAGVAYKPLYSAVPMTREQHDLQHKEGETAVLRQYGILTGDAKSWFDEQAEQYYQEWMRIQPKIKN